jgi:glyoxylase-like metal-dependent hydrolase (beta-lactamase superfamily II)
MEQLRDALWRWTAPHPDWTPVSDWDRRVSCFAHASGDGLILIDPLVESGDWTALDNLVERQGDVAAVALTVHFHKRDSDEAARRYGAELFAPASGARERIPGGVEPVVVPEAEEALLYLPGARTLVAGDLLLARDGRLSLCPASWLDREDDLESARKGAARALELPLDAIAVSHGEPPLFEGRAALEEALRA